MMLCNVGSCLVLVVGVCDVVCCLMLRNVSVCIVCELVL